MKGIRKITSILCALSILIGMMVTAPTALAAEDAKWVDKAPMLKENSNMSSVTFGNKIYVLGGYGSKGILKSVTIYDTATDKWSNGADMFTGRCSFAAVALNEKIYAIGGCADSGIQSSVEIYDPASNTWSQGKPLSTTRAWLTAAAANGKIYVIGGGDKSVIFSSVEIYDPVSDSWTAGKSMPTPLRDATSVVLDGKIYIMCGTSSNGYASTTYVYDIEHNTWELKAPVPAGITGARAVTIGNQIYLIGGLVKDTSGKLINSKLVYIYDVASDTWRQGPSMLEARRNFEVAAVDNVIYAMGGYVANADATDQFVTANVEALTVASTTAERKLAILLNTGETAQLSVSYDLTENASMTWSSSDQKVATVDTNGKVTAAGVGTCDISAQSADGTWKQSIPVRVVPGTADLFRLAVHLKPAQNAKLHLTDNPADTTWKSLDPAVATVDATGRVTAVSQGIAIMEAANNGQTHQIYVRVKA